LVVLGVYVPHRERTDAAHLHFRDTVRHREVRHVARHPAAGIVRICGKAECNQPAAPTLRRCENIGTSKGIAENGGRFSVEG
jgi:hypothetical protein